MKTSSMHEDWARAVVAVNRKSARQTGGRGFVVEVDRNRYVITAGHCLPKLPPAHPGSYLWERTFPNLLAPLGKKSTILAECLFVDPVADIAVLGQPDNQVYEQAAAYDELVDNAVALSIGSLTYTRERHVLPDGKVFFGRPIAETEVLLLSLDGHWFSGQARTAGNSLWLRQGADNIQSGMSGSPILLPDGRAVGAVNTNEDTTYFESRSRSWRCAAIQAGSTRFNVWIRVRWACPGVGFRSG